MDEPGHRESSIASPEALQSVLDLSSQLRRHPLVGVHKDDPSLGGLGVGEGLLISISRPSALDDSVRILAADLHRAIRTEGIDHNDLVTPPKAFEASTDVLFLVKANDDRRNLWPGLNHLPKLRCIGQKIEANAQKIKPPLQLLPTRCYKSTEPNVKNR